MLSLEDALGGLRAPGADCSADVRVHGQFWLLDRLALGRSFAADSLAVAKRSEYSDKLLRQFAGHSTSAVCDRLGDCPAWSPHLGRLGEQALDGQYHPRVFLHPFLHAMVRKAWIGAGVAFCHPSPDARLRARA